MDVRTPLAGYFVLLVEGYIGCQTFEDMVWESVQWWNLDIVCATTAEIDLSQTAPSRSPKNKT